MKELFEKQDEVIMKSKLIHVINLSKKWNDGWAKKSTDIYLARNGIKLDIDDYIKIDDEIYQVTDLRLNFEYTKVFLLFRWKILELCGGKR